MIQIAICDDDEQDLQKLKDIIREIMEKYALFYQIKEYDSGEKLLESSLSFHLIFLDIVLKGKDGMEVGKQIFRNNRSIKIIFQTNFGLYCKDAMNKSHAFAFLEKPLSKELVEEQIKEFIESTEDTQDILTEFKNVKYVLKGKELEKAVICISVKDIFYFEYLKLQKTIKIVTSKGNFIYSEAMNQLEERMKPLGFETSCRGILINLEKVMKIKGYTILLNTGDSVPLSQRRVSEFKERLNEYIHDSFH